MPTTTVYAAVLECCYFANTFKFSTLFSALAGPAGPAQGYCVLQCCYFANCDEN